MAGAQPKRILREAVGDALPAAVLARRDKIGFRAGPAVARSLATQLPSQLAGSMDGAAAEWLAPGAVAHMLAFDRRGIEDEFALWRLVNITLWADQMWS